jgi:single-strand selective monofunctional uracil DNA glycosylase
MNALAAVTLRLAGRLRDLEFPAPVACVYRPLDYAWEPHLEFLERFGNGRKRVVFLGMNPGPYGMTQTGVPFGEIAAVRDWLGISKPVGKPAVEHPKRPIQGFACKRSEGSGRRVWGLFQDRFGTPEAFFENHFVVNYCPLVWMGETGANLTPDKISSAAMAPVEAACAGHLRETLDLLQPDFLIGIGAFAEERLRRSGAAGKIGRILHPSPASPLANRGWPEAATRQLEELGVW